MTPDEFRKIRKFELMKHNMKELRIHAKLIGCIWCPSNKLIDSIINKEIKNKTAESKKGI